MPKHLPARLLVAGVAVSLLGWTGPAIAADAPGSPAEPSTSAQSEARSALAQAEDLFQGESPEQQSAGVPATGRDATLVLRDLARTAGDLPTRAQRAEAARILARPTDGAAATEAGDPEYTSAAGSHCGPDICVHWVEDHTADAIKGRGVTGNDGNIRTVPTFVQTTLDTMEHVYGTEVVRLGYRKPLSDGTRGGSSKTDVYLADVGSEGYYGYCTSDEPYDSGVSQIDAYCVLDNDYRAGQFPDHTPLENLQVTAAHEFFHAIQFAYDADEDAWLMEGTAAWMEDQVYDRVDDNRQYLADSMLSDPYVSLDYGQGNFEYGAWIFWRYLSESLGAGAADDPTIVRDVWNTTVGSTYSTQALRRVLLKRGTSFPQAMTTFGTWIRDPRRYFSEGGGYRAAPLDDAFTLTSSHRSSGATSVPVDHMTHSFARFTPGSSLTGRWLLRVSLNLPDTSRGSAAQMIVHKQDGGVSVLPVSLSSTGSATRSFGFVRSSVKYLELDLVNASARFRCEQDTTESCHGTPVDQHLTAQFSATAVR